MSKGAPKDLTEIQRRILAFIYGHICDTGHFPTFRRIQREFGWGAVNAARTHFMALHRKGYVRYAEARGGDWSDKLWLLKTPEGEPFRGFVISNTEGNPCSYSADETSKALSSATT